MDEIKVVLKYPHLLTGPKGLGRRLLSEIKTAPELFDWLQKNNFLDRNNLLILQAVLFKLGRMDLYEKAVVYAQSIGDVVHFSPPPKEPGKTPKYANLSVNGNCNGSVRDLFVKTWWNLIKTLFVWVRKKRKRRRHNADEKLALFMS